MTWPDVPVVARAYIDQLNRDGLLSDAQNAGLSAALASADAMMGSGGSDADLAEQLASLAAGLNADGVGITGRRKSALADTLNGIADKVSAGR